ncbi:MAG: uL30 family ribosomal protein [Nanoarchaeota archaeon]|nr:uL30 family ribosomal protein [Nanoarchaeota archaeon]MBU1321371.1 uL30 family ribosomal protein [Nanoarchaeota archaeon]MBU1597363.1 uL30 family ribosomal protein [Nanoarchaeota archaeon]MBU2441278.1 uL30 family ribosomal protein [Nanoarchaeota archaeon]
MTEQQKTQTNPVKKEEAAKKTVSETQVKPQGKLAIILIRGLNGVRKDMKQALNTLRLRKKHVCVVVEDTPSIRATLLKCKDYVTYGEIDDDTLKLLLEKRGKKDPNNKGFLKKFFALHPPRGGFERKGIKVPFNKGGVLGYRGAKISELIKKML